MEARSQDATEGRTFRMWIGVLSLIYLSVSLSGWLPAGYRATEFRASYLGYLWARSVLECLLVFWAARRLSLGSRLRQSLRLTGCAFAVGALSLLVMIPAELGLLKPIPNPVAATVSLASFLVGLVGILWMPTRQTRRSAWWVVGLDIAAAALGLSVALALVITMPQMAVASDPALMPFVLVDAGAQTFMLIGLNVLVVRGVARPSRRAFWLFVTMVFLNLLVIVLSQIERSAGPTASDRISDLFSALTSICTLWMVAAFRFDPIRTEEHSPGPDWFTTFNPLPLLATGGIALLLLYAVFVPGSWSLRLLAPVMVLQVLLILIRLFLTSHENARLYREEAAHELQRRHEKVAAVRRLTGGMAHWYNNLLTTVMGRAEIGSTTAGIDPAIKDGFNSILDAAERAGRLTNQLLSYGGGSFLRPVSFDLAEAVRHLCDQRVTTLPPNTSLQVSAQPERLMVVADITRIMSVVSELVANAVAAMPAGGTIRINLRQEQVQTSVEPCTLPVTAGSYAVIEVTDTGVGIPEHELAVLFDPFFTTQPIHAAAGLGLAEVYGVVAEHGGGLAVRSEPGRGARFTIHLPMGEMAQ